MLSTNALARRFLVALIGSTSLVFAAGCGSDTSQNSPSVPDELVGEWALMSYRPADSGLQTADPEVFDSRVSFLGDGTFTRTEWREGTPFEDSGILFASDEDFSIVSYEPGAQAAQRIDEGVWAIQDGRLALAVEEGTAWRLLVFERASDG